MKITIKTIIKIILRTASVAGIIALIWTFATYGKFVTAAFSVKQLDNHFYYMEFNGDYKLKKFLSNGGASSNKEMAVFIEDLLRGKSVNKVYNQEVPLNTGCAAISTVSPDGKKYFGRNYDWDDDGFCTGLIIKSNPRHGYKSISTTQLDFLGFGENFKPDSFGKKYLSTAALFIPLDGMNEKGLCISDLMAGDTEFTDQNNGKADITTTLAIRGILDFCKDVPEAIAFLEKYDMHSVIGYAHHFAISDAAGRMVVVEYVDNKMIVTETSAVTNHYVGVEREVVNQENSEYRLSVLNNRLEEKKNLTEGEVYQVMRDIRASQFGRGSKTWWRAVFNQTDLTVNYVLAEKSADGFEFDFILK